MKKKEELYPLILFNEKYEDLYKSGFIQNWKNKKLSYKADLKNDQEVKEIPNEDEIKSFILTLRFFIQDNEACSVRKLNQYYQRLDLPDEIISEFSKLRKLLNKYLDSDSNFNRKDKPKYSLRNIFENYIYGHYAHSNDEKRKIINQWNENKFIKSLTNLYFIKILYDVHLIIRGIKELNIKVIKYLSAD